MKDWLTEWMNEWVSEWESEWMTEWMKERKKTKERKEETNKLFIVHHQQKVTVLHLVWVQVYTVDGKQGNGMLD